MRKMTVRVKYFHLSLPLTTPGVYFSYHITKFAVWLMKCYRPSEIISSWSGATIPIIEQQFHLFLTITTLRMLIISLETSQQNKTFAILVSLKMTHERVATHIKAQYVINYGHLKVEKADYLLITGDLEFPIEI